MPPEKRHEVVYFYKYFRCGLLPTDNAKAVARQMHCRIAAGSMPAWPTWRPPSASRCEPILFDSKISKRVESAPTLLLKKRGIPIGNPVFYPLYVNYVTDFTVICCCLFCAPDPFGKKNLNKYGFAHQYPAFRAWARILPQMRAVLRTSVMSLRLFPNSTSRYRSARLWLYG